MLDFSKLKFDVIDLNVNANPDLFVNQNCITFSRRCLEDLSYPQYVQYCVDCEHKVFAVRPCKGNETKAVQFSKPKAEQTGKLTTNSRNLHDIVAALINDYDAKSRYRITGQYDAENRIMYFDMADAEVSMFHKQKESLQA